MTPNCVNARLVSLTPRPFKSWLSAALCWWGLHHWGRWNEGQWTDFEKGFVACHRCGENRGY